MHIYTKRIKVISMTKAELDAFMASCQRAAEGQICHYGESKLADGSFLGVSVVSNEDAAYQADKARWQANCALARRHGHTSPDKPWSMQDYEEKHKL